MKLLLVEDEALVALALKMELESHGYSCEIAATADAALRAVEARPPDCIFMDISLAGNSSGVVAAREIRRRWEIPLCFVSGYDADDIDPDSLGFQPVAYLSKPVSANEIIEVIMETFGD